MEPERYLEVDGRRWRRTDPCIPEKLRVELVAELMAARRAVAAALKAGDGPDERTARNRVHDAKVALGERGHPWWEPPNAEALAERVPATARALLRHRSPSTICPSDVARVVGSVSWRTMMPTVRALLLDEVRRDVLVLRQKGQTVEDLDAVRGPVRLAAGPHLGSSQQP